jgi:hypothetical protein
MSVDKAESVQEEIVDRKELLEQQFAEAERAEMQEPQAASEQPRDDGGKFAKSATPEPVAAPDEPPPVWKRPPASWKKDYHEPWNAVDDKIKEYVWQREEQMKRGSAALMSKAQFADAMNDAIQPYANTIRGLGITPEVAVQSLMKADHTLRTADPQQKLQYFMQLAQQYGIDLNGAQGQPQTQTQQAYNPFLNELTALRGEFLGWKQQQEAAKNQQVMNYIGDFAEKAEHFESVREAMIPLLESGAAQTLEDAYDMAVWSNPDIRATMLDALQAKNTAAQSVEKNRAAKAARAAAVSVRSSTPGTHTAPKAQDRRALLAEQFDAMNERL